MPSAIDKLLGIGGPSLSSEAPNPSAGIHGTQAVLVQELLKLLSGKNGFYAFEAALHIFPSQSTGAEIGLSEWNAPDLWIGEYQGMAKNCLFFAEDIFGGQFCIADNQISTFDPETGTLEVLSRDLDGWAEVILSDYEALTGYPLAHAWQQVNGPLGSGKRLVPITPFVMGGKFAVENLHTLDAVKGMRLRANLATQIRNHPDGTSVSWKITE